ncbi:hypothetical protein ACHAPT_008308 [Fusarium lateritium]
MPVTIKLADIQAEAVYIPKPPNHDKSSESNLSTPSSKFLGRVIGERKPGYEQFQVLQSTVTDEIAQKVLPQQNGLVRACLDAYNHHHHLVLRPDDVWIAIITQFSFYVNKHAEEMRSFFVAHEGKKELEIRDHGPFENANFAALTAQMADLIQENVLDKGLQEWIIPDFSTTTEIDTLVCSAVMMGNWTSILHRLDKLTSFGPGHPHLAEWKTLLAPVIQGMVDCFNPESATNAAVGFWSRIAHYKSYGSGPSYMSGWITAFCLFSAKGEWQGKQLSRFQDSDDEDTNNGPSLTTEATDATKVEYPYIDTSDIPPAWCEVDVTVKADSGEQLGAGMIAGLAGYSAFSSQAGIGQEDESADTVQPFPAWWFVLKAQSARKEA